MDTTPSIDEQAQARSSAGAPVARTWTWMTWAGFAVLGLMLGIQRADEPLGDSDMMWGARGGLDILDTGHVPHVDFYSWTVPGKLWVPNSWGWNVVLGLMHKLGGLHAIYVLGILLTIA